MKIINKLLMAASFATISLYNGIITPISAAEEIHVNNILKAEIPMSRWMKHLPNHTLISELSIPGTHDSGSDVRGSGFGLAQCQNLSIWDQLNRGIRFLDIRCRHIENGFAIHHGAFYQNKNFQDVLNSCTSFLKNNGSETILMSIKEEYNPADNTENFQQTFNHYFNEEPSRWFIHDRIPSVGEVRGKIVLLRRYNGDKGIDISAWPDNRSFIEHKAITYRGQDKYKVSPPHRNDHHESFTESDKYDQIIHEITIAQRDTNYNQLWFNFTSGGSAPDFVTPNQLSNVINPKINDYLIHNYHQGRVGIIPMDYCEHPNTLIPRIISLNNLNIPFKIENKYYKDRREASSLDAYYGDKNGRVFRSHYESENTYWYLSSRPNGSFKIENKYYKDHGEPASLDAYRGDKNGLVFRSHYESENTYWYITPRF